MIEKSSLLKLLDSGDLSKVLHSLKEQGVNDEKVKTIKYAYDLLEDKYKGQSLTTRKYKTELKKLIQPIRELIESSLDQDLKNRRIVANLNRIAKVIGFIGGAIIFLGSVAEMSGYSLRDLFFHKNEAKTDTLNHKVDISTSGDNSPAINSPGGDVKIEYHEQKNSKKATNKSNKTQN